jgi:hypothetical protein
MTTQLMRDMLAHPPPFEMDLMDANRAVGWIVGDTIGFRGFGDETEATHAAWVAHRTLARRLSRTHGTRLVPVDIEPLALERSDAGEADVILASNRPIATLIRPGSHSRTGDSFGFELAVPSPVSEFELRGVAYLLYRALRKSGVQWAMWRPDPAPRTEQMTEAAGVVAARAREPVRRPRRPARTPARRPFQRIGIWLRRTTDVIRRVSSLGTTTPPSTRRIHP